MKFNNLKLRTKMLSVFLTLIVLLMTVATWISSNLTQNAITDNIKVQLSTTLSFRNS